MNARKFFYGCGFVALCGWSANVSAGTWFVGMQTVNVAYEQPGSGQLGMRMGFGRIGYHINDIFAVEGRLGLGLTGDKFAALNNGSVVSASIDLDSITGAYVSATYPPLRFMNVNAINVTALAGLVVVDRTISGSSVLVNQSPETGGGMSYGVGVDLELTELSALNAEYISYYNADDVTISGYSFGLKIKF